MMPWLKMKDGTIAHICMRGSRNQAKSCSRCNFISTKLCDFVYSGGRRCDLPLCDDHAVETGPNLHQCPHHPVMQAGLFPQASAGGAA